MKVTAAQPETYRFWIGTETNPDDRLQIAVSFKDMLIIPDRGRANGATAEVADLLTDRVLTIRRASCGLPRCYCALEMALTEQRPLGK